MTQNPKPKILVILGPTATGKSDLAVELALTFQGEIISADSRQVYRGLDIGTGKITEAEMKGVPHFQLDVAEPQERFTVADWKKSAAASITDITSRGHLPIICGGTGFYIDALIDNTEFPEIEIDHREQKELESQTADQLYEELLKLDIRRAENMKENGERTNKRRLARAIMIAKRLGKVPPLKHSETNFSDSKYESDKISDLKSDGSNLTLTKSPYETLIIGLILPDTELKSRIKERLIRRLNAGMIEEAKRLHEDRPSGNDLSYERMDELGLEYRYLAKLLQGKMTQTEFIDTLTAKIWQYARRQKTWWRKDKRINWHGPNEVSKIKAEVSQFLAL